MFKGLPLPCTEEKEQTVAQLWINRAESEVQVPSPTAGVASVVAQDAAVAQAHLATRRAASGGHTLSF